MNIFVGNLSFETKDSDIKSLFEGFGVVASAVIVMRKEKKAPKSRGFGFVDMPDAVQALAAIAELHGKEFMGRIIDVEPERPKAETPRKIELEEKVQPVLNEHLALKDGQVRPSGQPGTYRGGRRTHSYIKKRQLAGLPVEVKPRKTSHDNPMRWRKKRDQAKPWQKGQGDHTPWKKPEGAARPWKKAEGESRPWKKPEGDARPWKKPAGDAKPWKKPVGDAKPWGKSSGRAQKPGFKRSKKPGGYKR